MHRWQVQCVGNVHVLLHVRKNFNSLGSGGVQALGGWCHANPHIRHPGAAVREKFGGRTWMAHLKAKNDRGVPDLGKQPIARDSLNLAL